MPITAVLTGTFRNPELRFSFGWGASLPNGKPAQEWIKNLPGRRWDKSEKTWYITGTGINPDKFFADLGIEVDFSEATGDLEGLTSLELLWRPLVQRSGRFPSTAFVRARKRGLIMDDATSKQSTRRYSGAPSLENLWAEARELACSRRK